MTQSNLLANSVAWLTLVSLFYLCPVAACLAQTETIPGKATSESPTFENLSISWPIQGDQNSDSQVAVRFKTKFDTEWKQGLPLIRVPAGSNCGFDWPNRHAGSLFGLEPNTHYEIELTLSDPDGGSGTQTISQSTKAYPVIAQDGISVTPENINKALAKLTPGQALVLDDGTYSDLNINRSGTSQLPVTIRAANPGSAIIRGDVYAIDQEHLQFVGLKVNGKIKLNQSNNILVHHCSITTERDGVVAYGERVSQLTITNNTIKGSTPWTEEALGNNGKNIGEGIVVTGPGHVIAHNHVEGFRDGISLVEDRGAFDQHSIDIYRNDIYRCADDGIEADFSKGNVRVYENRLTDCFMGISSQPSLGGPTYFIRNVLFNPLIQAFKLQRGSVGDICFHNTVVKNGDAFNVNTEATISRAWFANNLFIGGEPAKLNGFWSGENRSIYLPSAAPDCRFEFNGFGMHNSDQVKGVIGQNKFHTLSELQDLAQVSNAIQVDSGVFANRFELPMKPLNEHEAPTTFALKPNRSAAVDQGVHLPSINDQFHGDAPDLGAIEVESLTPRYGPLPNADTFLNQR
jgi:hypothetical protein